MVKDRQGQNPRTIHWVIRTLKEMGHHGPVCLRSDGEPTIRFLLANVATSRRAITLLEHNPREDSQSNGRVERTVRSIEEIARILKSDVEKRIASGIELTSPLFDWILRHSVDLLNKRQVSKDGLTAFERLRGRPYSGVLIRFGSTVLHRLSGHVVGGVLADRWQTGSWLGKTASSDEHIVGMPDGTVVRTRTVRVTDDPVHKQTLEALQPLTTLPETLQTVTTETLDDGIASQPGPRQPRGRRGLAEGSIWNETLPPTLDAQLDGWGESRRWQITAKVIQKCGLTPNCKGCRAISQNARHHQAHSEECRVRVESMLEDDPEWKNRIDQSRTRKTRADHAKEVLVNEPRTLVTPAGIRVPREPLETVHEELMPDAARADAEETPCDVQRETAEDAETRCDPEKENKVEQTDVQTIQDAATEHGAKEAGHTAVTTTGGRQDEMPERRGVKRSSETDVELLDPRSVLGPDFGPGDLFDLPELDHGSDMALDTVVSTFQRAGPRPRDPNVETGATHFFHEDADDNEREASLIGVSPDLIASAKLAELRQLEEMKTLDVIHRDELQLSRACCNRH